MTGLDLPLHGAGQPKPSVETLCGLFDHAVHAVPDTVAVRHLGTAVTYRELGRAADALAVRLVRMGARGQVAAVLLPNSTEFFVALFAAMQAGVLPALLNPLYPAPQLEPLLRAARPAVLLCGPASRDCAAALAATLAIPDMLCFGQDITVPGLAADGAGEPPMPRPAAHDPALILFSGGTTGVPKQVEYAHGALIAGVRCMDYVWPTRARGEVFLPVAPFTHVYGFYQGVTAPIAACAETVIPERFQPDLVVDLLARHRVTFFGGGPPAIYAGLLAAPNLMAADLSVLRVAPSGGAPFPMELADRWQRATGRAIHEGYGMTEMAPICGANELTGLRSLSVGKPLPCNQVQVVDIETGLRVLPPGERGEVRARGPQMMTGYRALPDETARVVRDGFVYTGDIGHIDADGFLFVTDRKKDVVFVKGFNVYPREVEEVIHLHPAVAAVGVVGAPDRRTGGERLVAYVVPSQGAALIEGDLAAHCAARLVTYQCPSAIIVVDQLPMTGAHKLDRLSLRALAAREST